MAAMLAIKNLAGVPLELNLRKHRSTQCLGPLKLNKAALSSFEMFQTSNIVSVGGVASFQSEI